MSANYATAVQEKPTTLNDRLNRLNETLQYQCDRIRGVLDRVHGNPTPIRAGKDTAAIPPTLSMANVIEQLEAATEKLTQLATEVERVA